MPSLKYYKRIFQAYLTNRKSHLTFWHGIPEVNENAKTDEIGEYYMPFIVKANYKGDYDENGIPKLNYQGAVGLQYNPIAIAQYGLGNYNLYIRDNDKDRYNTFIKIAEWLVDNLEENDKGIPVWKHHFDWEYRDLLRSGWYSALSQSQGVSLLVRAYKETDDKKYLEASEKAFVSFTKDVKDGGVVFTDEEGDIWLEETIVDPPTHILNGFMWAIWGIYDYALLTNDDSVKEMFEKGVATLEKNLKRYDTGYWSLYELAGKKLKMLASSFYHSLHIVQLKVMHKLTGKEIFAEYAERWEKYSSKKLNRIRSKFWKIIFKLLYY